MTLPEKIVDAALQRFYRHGFHASGVELLAKDAGVTKRTLYRHYPSKDVLIDAALHLRHQQFMAQLRHFVDAAPPNRRPLAYIDFIIAWSQEADFHGCAFINAAAEYAPQEAAPHRQAAAHKQEVRNYLLELCIAAQASRPAAIATSLYLLGEGLIVASQVQGGSDFLYAGAHEAAQALWDGPIGRKAEQ